MNTIILVILIILGVSFAFAFYILLTRLQDLKDAQTNSPLNQNLMEMNQRIDRTTETISKSLQDVSSGLNQRLTEAAKVIGSVQKELGTVQERFKGFEEFNELLHPKMRGNIGEQILTDMLSQVFSAEHYALQYKFRDGSTVDAMIRTKAGIVPIDSKFPLENFRQLTRATTEEERKLANREFAKAVKKHVDDISKKYILPEEGTVNFAVMYVPSENVYYHILTDEENDLNDYARSKNVVMTAPHGFFSFLRVIMMGMEREKLQEQAQKIWGILKGVEQESGRFSESLSVLSRHITNAKGAMDAVHSGYAKLAGKLDQVKLLE